MHQNIACCFISHATVNLSAEKFSLHFPAVLITSLCALVALAGCVTTAEQENRWAFSCPDAYEFTVTFSEESETVTLEDKTQKHKLDKERSASGALYTDGTIMFWNKGVLARVELSDGIVHQECQGDSI